MIVYGTKTETFKNWHNRQVMGKDNGAYWYSREIEDIILPKLGYDLFYLTAGATLYKAEDIPDGAVALCHHNRDPVTSYRKLFNKNILWICSKHSTVEIMKAHGENAVYVPLSIDTKYVSKYKRAKKAKGTAYAGNAWAFKQDYLASLPKDIQQLSGLSRVQLLKEMAKYERVIAEGRCLMEAQVLGAKGEVPIYKDLESVFVEPLDSRDAIPSWIEALKLHSQKYNSNDILIVKKDFNDIISNTTRREGEIFVSWPERAKQLLEHKAKIVEKLDNTI